MATKKYLELKEYTLDSLTSEIKESELDFKKLRFEHASKGLDNPLRLRQARRDVARLKTELRSRELAEMSPESLAKRSRIVKRRRSK